MTTTVPNVRTASLTVHRGVFVGSELAAWCQRNREQPHRSHVEVDTGTVTCEACLRPRFTVRKQSSGYTLSESFYVYDRQRGGRVTVHAHRDRLGAEADARRLNDTLGWTG